MSSAELGNGGWNSMACAQITTHGVALWQARDLVTKRPDSGGRIACVACILTANRVPNLCFERVQVQRQSQYWHVARWIAGNHLKDGIGEFSREDDSDTAIELVDEIHAVHPALFRE